MTAQQFVIQPTLTPVRVVATTNQSGLYFNGPLNNGVEATFTYTATAEIVIDGITVVVNDSILFIAQSNPNENGIYVVTIQGSTSKRMVLKRRSDFHCIEQIVAGQFVSVGTGVDNAGVICTLIEPLPAHFGINALLLTTDFDVPLGTAATKNTTDNNLDFVAAVDDSSPITAGHLAAFSDTTGTIEDNGFALVAGVTDVWGGSSTSHTFSAPGLTPSMNVVATIKVSSSAATSIVTAISGVSTGTLTVVFNGDPGAGTQLAYIGFG